MSSANPYTGSAGDRCWVGLALPFGGPPADSPPFNEDTCRGFMTGSDASSRTQQVLDALGIDAGGGE